MKTTDHGLARSAILRAPQLALLVTLAVSPVACKKADDVAPSAEPQAAQTEVTQSETGTTTTYAPPAPEPQAPSEEQPAQ